jgi:hypothetical protein
MSPAQAHRARNLAKVSGAGPASAGPRSHPSRSAAAATEYELQRVSLGVDLRRLHDIQSVERKIELKRELLPNYLPWIEGVLAADIGVQDDIVVHVMIWAFDIGDFPRGLVLGTYVLRHKLPLPDRFKRTAATLIAEEPADAALKAIGKREDFSLDVLLQVEQLTEAHDMPDVVKAKLCKAIGLLLVRAAEAIDETSGDGPAGLRQGTVERALAYLRRGYGLSHTIGVKKDIDRLEREIAKHKTEAAAAGLTSET